MTTAQDRKKMYEELTYGFPSRAKNQQSETKQDQVGNLNINEILSSKDNLIVPPSDFQASIAENIPENPSVFPPRKEIHQEELQEETKEFPNDWMTDLLSGKIEKLDSFQSLAEKEAAPSIEKEKVDFLQQPNEMETPSSEVQKIDTLQQSEPSYHVKNDEDLLKRETLEEKQTDVMRAKTEEPAFVQNPAVEPLSMSEEIPSTFMPRGSATRKSRNTGKKGKGPFPWAFFFSILFALIIVIVLIMGILFLNQEKTASEVKLPVQMKDTDSSKPQGVENQNVNDENQTMPPENQTDSSEGTSEQQTDESQDGDTQVVDGVEYQIVKHTVQRNESLTSISKKYFGTAVGIDLIYQWNRLTSAVISEGQILEVPIPLQ